MFRTIASKIIAFILICLICVEAPLIKNQTVDMLSPTSLFYELDSNISSPEKLFKEESSLQRKSSLFAVIIWSLVVTFILAGCGKEEDLTPKRIIRGEPFITKKRPTKLNKSKEIKTKAKEIKPKRKEIDLTGYKLYEPKLSKTRTSVDMPADGFVLDAVNMKKKFKKGWTFAKPPKSNSPFGKFERQSILGYLYKRSDDEETKHLPAKMRVYKKAKFYIKIEDKPYIPEKKVIPKKIVQKIPDRDLKKKDGYKLVRLLNWSKIPPNDSLPFPDGGVYIPPGKSMKQGITLSKGSLLEHHFQPEIDWHFFDIRLMGPNGKPLKDKIPLYSGKEGHQIYRWEPEKTPRSNKKKRPQVKKEKQSLPQVKKDQPKKDQPSHGPQKGRKVRLAETEQGEILLVDGLSWEEVSHILEFSHPKTGKLIRYALPKGFIIDGEGVARHIDAANGAFISIYPEGGTIRRYDPKKREVLTGETAASELPQRRRLRMQEISDMHPLPKADGSFGKVIKLDLSLDRTEDGESLFKTETELSTRLLKGGALTLHLDLGLGTEELEAGVQADYALKLLPFPSGVIYKGGIGIEDGEVSELVSLVGFRASWLNLYEKSDLIGDFHLGNRTFLFTGIQAELEEEGESETEEEEEIKRSLKGRGSVILMNDFALSTDYFRVGLLGGVDLANLKGKAYFLQPSVDIYLGQVRNYDLSTGVSYGIGPSEGFEAFPELDLETSPPKEGLMLRFRGINLPDSVRFEFYGGSNNLFKESFEGGVSFTLGFIAEGDNAKRAFMEQEEKPMEGDYLKKIKESQSVLLEKLLSWDKDSFVKKIQNRIAQLPEEDERQKKKKALLREAFSHERKWDGLILLLKEALTKQKIDYVLKEGVFLGEKEFALAASVIDSSRNEGSAIHLAREWFLSMPEQKEDLLAEVIGHEFVEPLIANHLVELNLDAEEQERFVHQFARMFMTEVMGRQEGENPLGEWIRSLIQEGLNKKANKGLDLPLPFDEMARFSI